MSLIQKPVQYYDNFVEVYGNRSRNVHFISMRFKQPILIYKSNSLLSIPIDPPNNTIVVIRGKYPPLQKPLDNVLLFSDSMGGIPITNDRVETLLRQLFPCDRIIFSYFKSEVLFLVATDNPFYTIMKKCPKDQVFKALCAFMQAKQKKRPLTLEEVSQLRFFKRYDGTLKQFNRWSSFAFQLCRESCYLTTCAYPTAFLGREYFLMLKRSKLPPGSLPAPDFYQCEILFTDTEPVGVAFLFENLIEVKYVSPMVVAKPNCSFRDSGSILCNEWLPLYQNPDMWRNYGIMYYAEYYPIRRMKLELVLSWLQQKTSEKYKLIRMDLLQVAKILFGEKSETYSKPT